MILRAVFRNHIGRKQRAIDMALIVFASTALFIAAALFRPGTASIPSHACMRDLYIQYIRVSKYTIMDEWPKGGAVNNLPGRN